MRGNVKTYSAGIIWFFIGEGLVGNSRVAFYAPLWLRHKLYIISLTYSLVVFVILGVCIGWFILKGL